MILYNEKQLYLGAADPTNEVNKTKYRGPDTTNRTRTNHRSTQGPLNDNNRGEEEEVKS